ncbi:hypothetical protein D9611_012695 [Ephemerocybe angulata]|uniref:Uncharacterized protein n=1 Tax=Ephemerocybe angulata TaxID=980116 RepID=A0A8H5B8Y9_9AGAR|nr:hypothetical protein D9611_012695 [Tulosesus angulatus]
MAFNIFSGSRPLLIQRLLLASTILCSATIGCSMVMLGTTSLFLSPAAFVLNIAFNITLLVLSAKEHKKKHDADNGPQTEPKTGEEATPVTTVLTGPKDPVPERPRSNTPPPLPAACRPETIASGILLVILWLAAFIVSFTAIIIALYRPGLLGKVAFNDSWAWSRTRLFASVAEMIAINFQISVMGCLCVVCAKERKSILALRDAGQGSRDVSSLEAVTGSTVPVATGMTVVSLSQAQKIAKLMVMVILFCFLILGLSMVNFGATSVYLTPISAGFTLLYSATLLVLIVKDLRMINSSNIPSPAIEGEPSEGHPGTAPPALAKLPWVGCLPTITGGFLLVVLWGASLVASLVWVIRGSTDPDFSTGTFNIPVACVEVGCIAPTLALFVYSSVLCLKERRRLLCRQRTV